MATKRQRTNIVIGRDRDIIDKCYELACSAQGFWPQSRSAWEQIVSDNVDFFNEGNCKQMFVTADGDEEVDWQRGLQMSDLFVKLCHKFGIIMCLSSCSAVKLAASKKGTVASRFPSWWQRHKKDLLPLATIPKRKFNIINEGLHTTQVGMTKAVNKRRRIMLENKEEGYEVFMTKCQSCGQDKMLPIWAPSKFDCLNTVCAERQKQSVEAAASNVAARNAIIAADESDTTIKCRECKCLPGVPCKKHTHVRLDSTLGLDETGLCLGCQVFGPGSKQRCHNCKCSSSVLQRCPCNTCIKRNTEPGYESMVIPLDSIFEPKFPVDSKNCVRCRRWLARRRFLHRQKTERPNILQGREIWSQVDNFTKRRVFVHFDKLYKTSRLKRQPVHVWDLTRIMPDIVWTRSVQDLRHVWNVYAQHKTSLSSSSVVTSTPQLQPPSPLSSDVANVCKPSQPGSAAAKDVFTKLMGFLMERDSLLEEQERLVTSQLSLFHKASTIL